MKTTETTFIALVQSLLKDPVERAYFFQVRPVVIIQYLTGNTLHISLYKQIFDCVLQEVFPVEYGPQYDAALHVLLWELLSKLEKLLPVPDLKQVFCQSIHMFQAVLVFPKLG